MFKFSLVMNGQFFEEGRYLHQWATYQDYNGADDYVTISCGIEIGQVEQVKIIEYNMDFDATVDTDLPA